MLCEERCLGEGLLVWNHEIFREVLTLGGTQSLISAAKAGDGKMDGVFHE